MSGISDAGLKALAACSLLAVQVLFGVIPGFIRRMDPKHARVRDLVMGLSNAFSGGLFLGNGLLHLLAEAVDTFRSRLPEVEAPLAFILAPLGFFLAWFIEKVVVGSMRAKKRIKHARTHDELAGDHVDEGTYIVSKGKGADLGNGTVVIPVEGTATLMVISRDHERSRAMAATETEDEGMSDFDGVVSKDHLLPTPTSSYQDTDGHGDGHDHHDHMVMLAQGEDANLGAIILIIILSLHAVLAGFVLGVQREQPAVLSLFFALLAHKWVEAFALGIAIVRSDSSPKTRWWPLLRAVAITAVMAPAGVLIGALLLQNITPDQGELVSAVAMAISSGTFIYVAIVDIMIDEFTKEVGKKYLKFLFVILGYGLTIGFALAFQDSHGGDDHRRAVFSS